MHLRLESFAVAAGCAFSPPWRCSAACFELLSMVPCFHETSCTAQPRGGDAVEPVHRKRLRGRRLRQPDCRGDCTELRQSHQQQQHHLPGPLPRLRTTKWLPLSLVAVCGAQTACGHGQSRCFASQCRRGATITYIAAHRIAAFAQCFDEGYSGEEGGINPSASCQACGIAAGFQTSRRVALD